MDGEKGRGMLGSFQVTFWVANLMELFERGAYYGLNSVLAVYLVDKLGFLNQYRHLFPFWGRRDSTLPFTPSSSSIKSSGEPWSSP